MTIRTAIAAALLFSLPLAAQETASVSTKVEHVVLVSIDGLRPEFYRDPSYPMPTLQSWAREGAQAEEVLGIFPSVTYPSHTTMITGALTARHGIYYNSPFELEGQTGRWYWEAAAIKSPTLWDACRAAGKKSASVSWPVSVGAPVDWLLPEVWPLEKGVPFDAPLRKTATPGLLEQIEAELMKIGSETFDFDAESRDVRVAQITAWILQKHKPAFITVHLTAPDHHMHEHGREHVDVRRALAMIDACLGILHEGAKRAKLLERTAFVVTGDHGFVNKHQELAPNVWLIEAGLRGPNKDRGPNYRATFHASGGGAFLHLAKPGDAEAVAKVREVLAGVAPGMRAGFRIVERAELDGYGVDPVVALALAAEDGWAFTSAGDGPALRPASGGTHGYAPELPRMQTGLVAWGAGVKPGVVARRLRMVDVAPLVARLLGVDFKAPDGVAPLGFFLPTKEK